MNNLEPCNNAFRFWLIHDKLPYNHICILASEIIPSRLKELGYNANRTINNCPYYSLLMSGISANEIPSACNGEASPLESFLYFQSKGLILPKDLFYLLKNELDEIQANLKKKIKRSKESHQRKEVRGDDKILTAVLKTLLDLYPDYPKEKFIFLKPVQEYANGSNHSEIKLKNMITEIERSRQKNRKIGNKSKEMKEKVKREILDSWKPESYAQNS